MKYKKVSISEKKVLFTIGCLAFFCYLLFNYVVPFDYFQHDLGSLSSGGGHIGYMQYIVNNRELPIFSINPMKRQSFYNPPLHYMLSAFWIKLTLYFTNSPKVVLESIQVMTSLYMACVLVFFYKILFLLKIKHKILCWFYLCFNPIMFILSSSINNDGLAFLTTVATLYYGLKWYQKPFLISMIKAALFMGLALMTKFNSILIIAILSLIFVLRFFHDKTKRKFYAYQLLTFFLLMLPIGGWYYGYAYIKYNMPMDFVQGRKDSHDGLSIKHTMLERFTHNEWGDFYYNRSEDKNWNMWALGIKTSLYNKYNYKDNPTLNFIAGPLLYASTFYFFIICFCVFWYLLYCPIHKVDIPNLILSMYILLLLSAYSYFNYYFPRTHTANFRYIPTFFICSILLWEKFFKNNIILLYLLPTFIAISSLGFYSVLTYQKLF